MDAISTAVSGLSAASQRIAVSANNVANANSTTTVENGQSVNKPYLAQEVLQSSRVEGGVTTNLRDVSPPSVPVFSPDDASADADGFIQLPNVDLSTEMATQIQAANTYKANLNVIKRANESYDSLLDINT